MFPFLARPTAARRRSALLRLEALEDRCTPSVNPFLPEDPPGFASIQFSPIDYSVGEGAGSATLTVIRTDNMIGIVRVQVRSIAGGSATPGSDFTPVDRTLTFLSGDGSESFTVPINNDAVFEGNETVFLQLSLVSGLAEVDETPATLTIVDDDPAPPAGAIHFTPTAFSFAENSGTLNISNLTRIGGTFGAVSVRVRSTGGTATAGSDYAAMDQVVHFADGQVVGSFTVALINDTLFEGNETFTMTLSDPTGGVGIGSASTASFTIVDDDPAPPAGSLQFGTAAASVGEGVGSATITLTRANGSFGAVSVRVRSTAGSATPGSDYAAIDQVVHFIDGQTSATFAVTIFNDTLFEGNETFTMTLSDPTGGGTLGSPSTLTLTINDDDPAPPVGSVQFGTAALSAGEGVGSATITLTRANGSFGAVSVRVRSAGGSATAGPGGDYAAVDQVVTFADGQTSASFTVTIFNDSTFEGNETVTLTLSDPTGGAGLGNPSTATLTITDDDPVGGDVSDRVQVSRGAFRRVRPGRFRQEVTLTNTGDRAIQGPLSLELTKLPGGRWKLVKNPAAVPGPDNVLDPGESVSLVLVFRSKKARHILYSTRVLANPVVIPT